MDVQKFPRPVRPRLHFDYRGLIDAGLAVSVHDLPTNPYET